ncbi:MAG: hypothetical protein P4L85_11155 [Paludisphaera borealis]|uniref:hypothetical protein n=1 Tax=Paludisphaera borealis TaxID=1387353 RepID=UPI00283F68D2|nr:hypothetical protein [Paludisphaera borealis]MDR3619897.1 hypothetical protein [Paludisphaera borealis]
MCRFTMRAVLVVGSMILASGCGGPAFVQVETVIRSDGSCDRLIWQPKGEMLPDDALAPAWNARWKGVSDVLIPPAFSAGNQQPGDRAYFHAHGGFRSPADIPAHFLKREASYPDLGASELTRSYERKDLGFVVEHRWRETITNIVTRESFLKARGEFLEIGIPMLCEGIEQVYGDRYDVAKVVADVRTRGRRFLDDATLAYYEMLAKHEAEPEKEREMKVRFAGVLQRLGVDLFDEKGSLVESDEGMRRIKAFARGVISQDFKRRDGQPLSEDEVQAILESAWSPPHYDAWATFTKAHEKEIKTKLGPLLLRMTGLYSFPGIFAPPGPVFAFTVRLPGKIVEAETNGAIADSSQVRWDFDGARIFPDGYEMKAASVDFDEEMQRRLLGRVVIADLASARAYRELVGEEGTLLDLVRRACRDDDIRIIREARGDDELKRAELAELKQFLQLAP